MRVLVLPLNYDHVQHGQMCGFRRVFRGPGDSVEFFDYMNTSNAATAFVDKVASGGFDWVWMQLQETGRIPGPAIQEARSKSPSTLFTHWMGDWRATVTPNLASVCAATDISFLSNDDPVYHAMYKAAGAPRTAYVQIGVDWREDVLGEPAWEPTFRVPPVVFCGGYYANMFPGTGARETAVRALVGAGVDVGIVGNGWPGGFPVVGSCTVKQQRHVYRHALVALNVNHANGTRLYYSDRQLIAMASGTPLVCKWVPGLDEEFTDGAHCLFYRSEGELVDRVKELLSNAGLRARIGHAGRSLMIRDHTWERRVWQMRAMVEKRA